MEALTIVKSITYFLIADLFEIGGGYLIWLWIREGRQGIIGPLVSF